MRDDIVCYRGVESVGIYGSKVSLNIEDPRPLIQYLQSTQRRIVLLLKWEQADSAGD